MNILSQIEYVCNLNLQSIQTEHYSLPGLNILTLLVVATVGVVIVAGGCTVVVEAVDDRDVLLEDVSEFSDITLSGD